MVMLVDKRISVKRVSYASSAEGLRRCGMIRATTTTMLSRGVEDDEENVSEGKDIFKGIYIRVNIHGTGHA